MFAFSSDNENQVKVKLIFIVQKLKQNPAFEFAAASGVPEKGGIWVESLVKSSESQNGLEFLFVLMRHTLFKEVIVL